MIRRQFSEEERLQLVSLLQAEEDIEPTNEQIVDDFRAAYRELKQGTLKTRPAKELLDEL